MPDADRSDFTCADCEDTGFVWEPCERYECEYACTNPDAHGRVPCGNCRRGALEQATRELGLTDRERALYAALNEAAALIGERASGAAAMFDPDYVLGAFLNVENL